MSTILNLLNLYSCYTYIISQLFIPSNYLIGSIFMHKYNAFQYFNILNALFCSVCSFCSFYSYTWDTHIQSNLFTFFLFLISIIIFKTIEKKSEIFILSCFTISILSNQKELSVFYTMTWFDLKIEKKKFTLNIHGKLFAQR